jgi:hypothetical protein
MILLPEKMRSYYILEIRDSTSQLLATVQAEDIGDVQTLA